MTIDFNKPVQRLDGKAVRILSTTVKHEEYPIVGIIEDTDGTERVETYTLEGMSYKDDNIDDPANLRNVPETKYKLVYSDGYIVPQAKWMTSKAQFEIENYEKSERLGYLAQAGDVIAFEPL